MKRRFLLPEILSIVFIIVLTGVSGLCAEKKGMTTEQKMQRVLDYMEIQNVMAKHSYYYAAQEQWKELDEAWSKKRDDISYGHNDGYYVGRKSVEAYYGQKNETRRKQTLESISRLYPEIKNIKENEGVGDLVMHTLTTPYIEIAEDGQTAKGVWMSIGLCSGTGNDGKASAIWLWEKFATDFIKEDGEWKIWHFQIYSDVLGNVDAAMLSMFAQQNQGGAMPSSGQQP
ncbi:MAG: nuclear transport factor 2 family protein, partial [Deltaproteobacteria bacterium]|nr:nuclear transport factor 2 family protein [Deltaproteobacteria bacterium]